MVRKKKKTDWGNKWCLMQQVLPKYSFTTMHKWIYLPHILTFTGPWAIMCLIWPIHIFLIVLAKCFIIGTKVNVSAEICVKGRLVTLGEVEKWILKRSEGGMLSILIGHRTFDLCFNIHLTLYRPECQNKPSFSAWKLYRK